MLRGGGGGLFVNFFFSFDECTASEECCTKFLEHVEQN